MELRDYAQP